ncbi:hypothetical protein THOM_0585, partial [Trachipleistophora hominis]
VTDKSYMMENPDAETITSGPEKTMELKIETGGIEGENENHICFEKLG